MTLSNLLIKLSFILFADDSNLFISHSNINTLTELVNQELISYLIEMLYKFTWGLFLVFNAILFSLLTVFHLNVFFLLTLTIIIQDFLRTKLITTLLRIVNKSGWFCSGLYNGQIETNVLGIDWTLKPL